MSYKNHDLQQGSEAWHKFRAEHFGASEAAAMLGLSKYTTRNELLRLKSTGISKDVDANTQRVFDRGHETEALARPIIEAQIGEQLSPVTLSMGNLSCSCDGLTFDDTIAWEHKQFNALLANAVALGELPEEHQPQCQQILMITAAEKLIFTVSDGTEQNMVSMEVLPDSVWFQRILAGWENFDKDLKNYVPVVEEVKPQAETIRALPSVFVQATGMVTASNLKEFKESAESFIANINTELATDQQFADAEATVKFCKDAESNLEATKQGILAQTTSIDDAIKTLDHIQAKLRDKRLLLDKLVKSEKEARKLAIVTKAANDYAAHIESLEAETKPIRLAVIRPDFGGATKGLKKLSAMQEAVDTELRDGKFAADQIAKDVRAKLTWCKDNAAGMSMLFPDLAQIITKPMDDFTLTITSRIDKHKEDEAAKEAAILAKAEADAAAKLEAERAQMQAQEAAKAKAAQDALLAAEREKMEADVREAKIKSAVEFQAVKAAEFAEQQNPASEVVIENQDVIGAFMASRDFGKEAGKVRAILVEFVKWSAKK